MGAFIDLTGKTFGRLTVSCRVGTHKNKIYWRCECLCGNTKDVSGSNLTLGKIQSCGCIKSEILSTRNKEKSTHNLTGTPLYRLWDGIKKRASKHRNTSKPYPHYRDRGIFMCDDWDSSFLSFYNWALLNGYKRGLQIDRIDNEGGYSPDNCRFVTSFQNSMNRRTTLQEVKVDEATFLVAGGCSIAEASRITNMKYSGIYQRVTGRRGIEKFKKGG